MPKRKQRLNVAMVGSGFIARAHSNAFHQVTHFFDVPYEMETKVICGRTPAKLDAFAAQWGWKETATDWRSVVTRADVDIVDIATPNALHAPIALAAANAGKIILCEKPLAMSAAEARQMSGAIGSHPSLVWFNYRRIPAVAFAKQLIDEGRIGQVFHYRSHYFNQSGVDPARRGVVGWAGNVADNNVGAGEAGAGVLGLSAPGQ